MEHFLIRLLTKSHKGSEVLVQDAMVGRFEPFVDVDTTRTRGVDASVRTLGGQNKPRRIN